MLIFPCKTVPALTGYVGINCDQPCSSPATSFLLDWDLGFDWATSEHHLVFKPFLCSFSSMDQVIVLQENNCSLKPWSSCRWKQMWPATAKPWTSPLGHFQLVTDYEGVDSNTWTVNRYYLERCSSYALNSEITFKYLIRCYNKKLISYSVLQYLFVEYFLLLIEQLWTIHFYVLLE